MLLSAPLVVDLFEKNKYVMQLSVKATNQFTVGGAVKYFLYRGAVKECIVYSQKVFRLSQLCGAAA